MYRLLAWSFPSTMEDTTAVIKEEEANISPSDEGMREEDETDRCSIKKEMLKEWKRLSTGQGR